MDIDLILAGLAKAPVYVAPGATDSPSAASDYTALLSSNDGIRIVVIPVSVTDSLESVAKQIDAKQPHGTTVIVAREKEVAAVSSGLPSGVSADLLARAKNVSGNANDTISTYVGNVHDFQAAHPQSVATVGQPAPLWAQPFMAIPYSLLGIVLVGAVILMVTKKRRRLSEKVKGNAPRSIRPYIRELMEVRAGIESKSMRQAIEMLCERSEGYAKRVDDDQGQETLAGQLRDAVKVSKVYLDIERNRDYYDNPAQLVEQGRSAILGLEQSVLASIRTGSSRRLIEYGVNTKILSAQKYR